MNTEVMRVVTQREVFETDMGKMLEVVGVLWPQAESFTFDGDRVQALHGNQYWKEAPYLLYRVNARGESEAEYLQHYIEGLKNRDRYKTLRPLSAGTRVDLCLDGIVLIRDTE